MFVESEAVEDVLIKIKKSPKLILLRIWWTKWTKSASAFQHIFPSAFQIVFEKTFIVWLQTDEKKTLIIQLRNLVGRLKQLTTLSPLCNPLYLLL